MRNKKIVIYQAFVRHFSCKKGQNIKNGTIEQNLSGKFNFLTDKALTSIANLGATHIWLTGIIEYATQTPYNKYDMPADSPDIVKGKAGSPYAVRNYYNVAPDLADNVVNRMQEFENLIVRVKKAGLEAIIDFVPNHVARQYRGDLGKKDDVSQNFSPQNNFYYLPNQPFSPQFELTDYQEFPAKATGNDCFSPSPSKNDWYETIKLNYGIDYHHNAQEYFNPMPDTWHKMLKILLFWAEKGVSGFRCDMAEMVPVAFWHWAIGKVKRQFPQIIFIAEIYNPNQYRNYIEYGKFDYLYDKAGLYDTLRGVVCSCLPAKNITYCWQQLNDLQPFMLNFLENHDEQRIASYFFAQNPQKAMPAIIVLSTLNTCAVMIYGGQELGERGMDNEGFSGLDGRTSIFDYWQPDTIFRWVSGNFTMKNLTLEEKKLRNSYKKILNLCNSEKAISQGVFFDLMYENIENKYFNSEKCFAFIRAYRQEILLIVANFASDNQELKLKIPQHAFDFLNISPKLDVLANDLLTGKKFNINFSPDILLNIDVEGFSGVILKI